MKKLINVKNVIIGGDKVPIQTMLSRKTVMVEENLQEIELLRKAGCDLVRIAVSSNEDLVAFKTICDKSTLPIVSDIQYDYKLAIRSVENGASKIRINPSNIGGMDKLEMVCHALKANNVPLRVGVNMGSLDEDIQRKYGRTAIALAKSCVKCADTVEKFGVSDIVLSVKCSSIKTTIEACTLLHQMSDYPQHIGLTEAGTINGGVIKNSIAVGCLLLKAIGNTIRVSLSAPPIEEVYAAHRILRSLGMEKGVELISCPTCNRCNYDLYSLANEVEKLTMGVNENIRIAVMGCAVNGIGESKDADIGIVGGADNFVVFKGEKIVANLKKDNYKEEFLKMIGEVIDEKTNA